LTAGAPSERVRVERGERHRGPQDAKAPIFRPHGSSLLQVPAPFEYASATSVDNAIELLSQLGPEARLLAGGHSLLPMMKLRLASPEYLIDIDPLAQELGYVTEADHEVRIGAMTRHRDLLESDLLGRRLAIFTDAERVIADPVVRNRGTIGGALCQADPSEDLVAVCGAVGAQMVIRGLAGDRVLGMREFYRGPYRTAVGAAEMLVEIRVPLHENSGSAYEKVDRRVGDWAVAAAGASITLAGDKIAAAGIALAAVGAHEVTCADAVETLIGNAPSDELFALAARHVQAACSPVSDQRGSADYKRHVTGVLVERTLASATIRARATAEQE
jgi:aerobic carbon-monoxide dehydrogenase medium subunit